MGPTPTRRALVAPLLVLALAVTAPVVAPAGAQAVTYVAPVDAPVVEGYSAPASPYGAGNRGLDYATTPGAVVRASAAGTVSFAGPVAGARHVTVAHPDGIRTTYANVAEVLVVRGQQVDAGQAVALAGERLHLSARLGEAYLDPAALLAAGRPPGVRLVPDDGGRNPGPPPSAGPAVAPPATGPGIAAAALSWLGARSSPSGAAAAGTGPRPT